jgi:hypothetical protein
MGPYSRPAATRRVRATPDFAGGRKSRITRAT